MVRERSGVLTIGLQELGRTNPADARELPRGVPLSSALHSRLKFINHRRGARDIRLLLDKQKIPVCGGWICARVCRGGTTPYLSKVPKAQVPGSSNLNTAPATVSSSQFKTLDSSPKSTTEETCEALQPVISWVPICSGLWERNSQSGI